MSRHNFARKDPFLIVDISNSVSAPSTFPCDPLRLRHLYHPPVKTALAMIPPTATATTLPTVPTSARPAAAPVNGCASRAAAVGTNAAAVPWAAPPPAPTGTTTTLPTTEFAKSIGTGEGCTTIVAVVVMVKSLVLFPLKLGTVVLVGDVGRGARVATMGLARLVRAAAGVVDCAARIAAAQESTELDGDRAGGVGGQTASVTVCVATAVTTDWAVAGQMMAPG